jgi:secreted PhoX family phosphatase
LSNNNKKPVDIDDIPINPSANPWVSDLLTNRRSLLKGGLGLALSGFLGGHLSGCETHEKHSSFFPLKKFSPKIGFTSVAMQDAKDFDQVIVAEGYTARAFFSWGDEVISGAVPWKADASNTWQEQQLQAGQNHDGMAYFPFADAPNDHGLLVINHEYTNPTLHPNGPTETRDAQGIIHRPADEVLKEQAAHGVSVIEIKRDQQGVWQRVKNSSFNRRLTANTPMEITGPAAGSEDLKTLQDPTATRVLGTLNNCAMGKTPWGTYLICEENWNNYFVNRNAADWQERVSHKRYGISNQLNSSKYYWETVDPRFDATPNDKQLFNGFVNEPNRFGWVVEFDPFDPNSLPQKRTALGRYAREGATPVIGDDGEVAIYSGDDTRGEYIYKFVARQRFDKANAKAKPDLLDEGILYVAVFHADGRGEWLPLVWGTHGLTARNGFMNQADVLINARAAADILGATPMDRPEWIAVDPHTRELYVTLTNNIERGINEDQPIDAANPRQENHHGQILRWAEKNSNPAATEFTWEIFLLAGNRPQASVPKNHQGNIRGDLFSCPDGLWFDADGRLWIETDYDDEEDVYQSMGCNQLLCADPLTREVKRFLVGPRGCEITGLTKTPDGKSMWLNIQHPGISYPASDGKTRPRSTSVLVTKDDGGVIGT